MKFFHAIIILVTLATPSDDRTSDKLKKAAVPQSETYRPINVQQPQTFFVWQEVISSQKLKKTASKKN